MRYKHLLALMGTCPVLLLAFHTGPPIKRTGIIDGGTTCTQCHRTFAPANSDPTGSVTIANLQPYVPGVTQTLKITVNHPQATRWGFQLTARFVTGNGTIMAGSFAPVDAETKVQCDDGSLLGSPGPCAANQLQWIEHADAPQSAAGAGHTFTVMWTPPADENGDVILYVAGNAANGDGTNNGDRIYDSSARISLSADAGCSISTKPAVRTAVNAGAHAGPIAPNAMVEIYGQNFQAGSRTRTAGLGDLGTDLKFPTSLSCVAVEIAGTRVPVSYVQQDQVNVQAPTVNTTGPVTLTVIANPGRPNELRSDPATIQMQALAPAFFTFGTTKSVAAQFAGTADVVADPSVVSGGKPAKPGDMVTLYGTGFGFTQPVWQAGEISNGLSPCQSPVVVSIGGATVPQSDVQYAGLAPQSISGLYQFNVRVPAAAANGNLPVSITVNGVSTPSGATIPVQR
jgi:uncharacterized protein (TIGR03437 family)